MALARGQGGGDVPVVRLDPREGLLGLPDSPPPRPHIVHESAEKGRSDGVDERHGSRAIAKLSAQLGGVLQRAQLGEGLGQLFVIVHLGGHGTSAR